MGASLGGGDDDVIADINITPFVDIVLVVLIIFMVTATTIVESSIKVSLPDAATGEANDDITSLGLTLTTDGGLLLDGSEVSLDALKARLREAKAAGDVVCLISADKTVEHGRVVWLIDVIRSEGIGKFAINVDPAATIPPDPFRGAAPAPADGG
jgi:biopolymer transport protein ExbD